MREEERGEAKDQGAGGNLGEERIKWR